MSGTTKLTFEEKLHYVEDIQILCSRNEDVLQILFIAYSEAHDLVEVIYHRLSERDRIYILDSGIRESDPERTRCRAVEKLIVPFPLIKTIFIPIREESCQNIESYPRHSSPCDIP
jgi:hypothetical protein